MMLTAICRMPAPKLGAFRHSRSHRDKVIVLRKRFAPVPASKLRHFRINDERKVRERAMALTLRLSGLGATDIRTIVVDYAMYTEVACWLRPDIVVPKEDWYREIT